METFTLALPLGRILRGLGSNGLLRVTDRLESLGTLLALLVVTLAIPVAASIGTSAYDRSSRHEVAYAAALHRVPATVVGDVVAEPNGAQPTVIVYRAPVTWSDAGAERTATVEWPTRIYDGDVVALWLDASGRISRDPAPEGTSVSDAVAVAVASWLGIAGVAASSVLLLRWRLDAARLASWDRALQTFADGGSRH